MKKHKIDQLFSDKLKDHKTPPPTMAWEKLEGELGGTSKKRMGVWWKVAAVILLCLSAGLWVYQHKTNDQQQIVQQKIQEKPTIEQPAQSDAETEILKEKEQENPSISSESNTSPQLAEQRKPSFLPEKEQKKAHKEPGTTEKQPKPAETQASEAFVAEQPVNTIEKMESIASVEEESVEELAIENTDLSDEVTAVAMEVRKPVKIIYKANTNATNEVAEAEKDSKLLEVVKDIKNGDLGLAELRDAKTDLIAAAFFKWKDKRDNKQ